MSIPSLDKTELLRQKLQQLNQFKIDLGLDRLKQVIHRLSLTDIDQTIMTVGGTNGKGSTVAALGALLKTKSVTYGAFTSPHIFKFNERIQVNGVEVSDAEILSAFDDIERVKKDISLSYFEYAFLAALLIFVERKVDVMVLEVGLGGRLDATNAVDADVSIITTVDIDHTEWLGDDIESIAYEKAGIMRAKKPVIFGDKHTPQSISDYASEVSAELLQLDKDFHLSLNPTHLSIKTQQNQFEDLVRPAVQGDWQLKNFSSALMAMQAIGESFSLHEVQHSLDNWHIKGRLQTIQVNPMVVVDVAHNKQGVTQLVDWLAANPVDGITRAVFSVLNGKQLDSWLGLLDEVIDHWFAFQIQNDRAMDIDQLKTSLADNVGLISVFSTATEAYQSALNTSSANDRVVVFGSFHVLDEVFAQSPGLL